LFVGTEHGASKSGANLGANLNKINGVIKRKRGRGLAAILDAHG
jgi:hypothetical protein